MISLVEQRHAGRRDDGAQFVEVPLRLIGERDRRVADPADLDSLVDVESNRDDRRIQVVADDARRDRPEIYAATAPAGDVYRPSLEHPDDTPTDVACDRVERSQLAAKQGAYTDEHFEKPYCVLLQQWAADYDTALAQ